MWYSLISENKGEGILRSTNILAGVAALGIAIAMSGCSVSPVQGAINVAKWDGPISNPTVSAQKNGEACAHSILGLVAFGDASIETAKRNAGIKKVATVDHRTLNVFYFYGGYCTVVYGE